MLAWSKESTSTSTPVTRFPLSEKGCASRKGDIPEEGIEKSSPLQENADHPEGLHLGDHPEGSNGEHGGNDVDRVADGDPQRCGGIDTDDDSRDGAPSGRRAGL